MRVPLFTYVLVAILWAAPVVSAFGGISIGAGSVSALATTVAFVALLVAFFSRGASGPPEAMRPLGLLAVLAGWLLAVGIANRNYPDISAAQQSAVWLTTGLALVLASSLSQTELQAMEPHLDRAARLGVFILLTSFTATKIFDEFPVSPRIIGLGALVPLAWSLARWNSGRRWWLTSALLTFLIVLTLSRTASLIAVLLIVIIFVRNYRLRPRMAALISVIAVGSYGVVSRWSPVRERYTTGDVSLSIFGFKINAEGRTRIWEGFIIESRNHLMTGNGSGSARSLTESIAPGLGHPHQDYLRLVYEGGLIALMMWLAILALSLAAGHIPRRHRFGAKESPDYANYALSAVATVAISSLTDNTLVYPFMMLPFGVAVGFSIADKRARASSQHVKDNLVRS